MTTNKTLNCMNTTKQHVGWVWATYNSIVPPSHQMCPSHFVWWVTCTSLSMVATTATFWLHMMFLLTSPS